MKTKICSKCKKEKPLNEFHKRTDRKCGVYPSCKECKKMYRQLPYVAERNKILKRTYRQKSSHKTTQYKLIKKYKVNHKKRLQANWAVSNAVKAEKFTQASIFTCFWLNCKKPAQHHHHWNYKKKYWFSTIPLCASHHKEIHQP